MKTYARIQGDTVVEIIEADRDIADLYHPDFVATLVDVTGHAPRLGQVQSGDSFIDLPEPAIGAAALKVYANQRQASFLVEPFSFTTGGKTLDTRCDDSSRSLLAWLGLWAVTNAATPTATRTYYNLDGSAVAASVTDITAFLTAVGDHVQDSFDRCSAALAQIEAGTITTHAGVDAAFS